MNRGNDRRRIFHKQSDYAAFAGVLSEALSRYQVELFCWCLMPNHWHLVVQPRGEKSLPSFMRWITVTHVRRYYEHYSDQSGHLYQGRFKAFPVEEDRYFLNLCRYVEANPKRANLVDDATRWKWSSLSQWLESSKGPELKPWPVDRPEGWIDLVNQTPQDQDVADIKTSLIRGRPLGSDSWSRRIASRSGLLQAMRPIGRPTAPLNTLSPRQRQRRQNDKLPEGKGQKGK